MRSQFTCSYSFTIRIQSIESQFDVSLTLLWLVVNKIVKDECYEIFDSVNGIIDGNCMG